MRLLAGERLSIHASICKVSRLTLLCLISLPSCTAEPWTWPTCVRKEGCLQCLSLANSGYQIWVPFGTQRLLVRVTCTWIRGSLKEIFWIAMSVPFCWPKPTAPKLCPGSRSSVKGQAGVTNQVPAIPFLVQLLNNSRNLLCNTLCAQALSCGATSKYSLHTKIRTPETFV